MESSKGSYLAVNGIYVCVQTHGQDVKLPPEYLPLDKHLFYCLIACHSWRRDTCTHTETDIWEKTTNKQSTNSVGQ